MMKEKIVEALKHASHGPRGTTLTIAKLKELAAWAERYCVRCDRCGATFQATGQWFWLNGDWVHACVHGKGKAERNLPTH